MRYGKRMLFVVILALCPFAVFAQESVKQQRPDSLGALKTSIAESQNKNQTAALTAAWLKDNAFDKLGWREQIELLTFLDSYDKVDKRDMSVRWTGKISAPVTGIYTFEQLRTYYTDGIMKLRIAGNLVLESQGAGMDKKIWDFNPDRDAPSFKSSPVALKAGESAEFVLEYGHNMKDVRMRHNLPMGFPAAVLMWQSDVMERQIVPQDVFTLPAGKKRGLQAVYFADSAFSRKAGERVDAAVDFVWDKEPVFNEFLPYRKAIIAANLPRVTSTDFYASLNQDDIHLLATKGLTALLTGMSATERDSLIANVSAQPRLLKEIPLESLVKQLEIAYMLPGKKHLNYLIKWSELHDAAPFVPGTFVNGAGTYAEQNIEPYQRIGRLLGKPYVHDLDEIVQNHLERDDGGCNLALTYVALCAGRESHSLARVLQKIDETLADKKTVGDARAGWLLARAFAVEVAVPPVIRIGRGQRDLNEALGTAESFKMRYRIFREIIARKTALGQGDEAKSFAVSMRNQFNAADQQENINVWQTSADSLKKNYQDVRNQQNQNASAGYKKSLQKYQDNAKKRNDTVQAARIQRILDKDQDSQ